MRIIGHGIDIERVGAVQSLLSKEGGDFAIGWFTDAEQALGPRGLKESATHFTGRVAAKEAVVKALGTGWIGEMAWTDIEILSQQSGAPGVTLSGETRRTAESLSVTSWMISISHTDEYAVASAIALGQE